MRSRLPAATRDAAEWVRRFARTAPGVLGAVTAILVIACLISGLVCANQLNAKIDRRDTVLGHTEPLADAAQRLYVALSAADAAASSAFLSGGIESPEVRTRYRQALTDAAVALSEATTGASDAKTREIVARISSELPTYTGLVEAARANNRQQLPVGAAYLRQASALMQTSVLKNAEELEQNRLARLRADQDDITALPGTGLLTLLIVAALCGYLSWVLLRRTNRRVNAGVLTALGLTVLALLWICVATVAATQSIDAGAHGATTRFETLARARILAQQARTEETLQLVTRGDLTESEKRFEARTGDLKSAVTAAAGADSPAMRALTSWQDGHKLEVAAYQGNDYKGAVAQSIGTGAGTSATKFGVLDDTLRGELEAARTDVRDGVDAAGDALTLSPWGVLALLLAAAAALVIGVWPRLKEFL
ncbi:hypothetical protein [Nocardia yamanashiensis]|uniref:hypothetical protein n=1 Tax=Nocardia yamanashiensis TaxID=209247 RepID=UPI001F3EC948|nr:hypothetical protein [Nocardia yamanashiensis]